MAESRIKRENYISVMGFMVKDLKLKGNELLVYAIIYGFTQAEKQVFSGSLQYLAEWTNSTKQGVIKCLKSLIEKGYIIKADKIINGVKFCEYYATELNTLLNKVEHPIKQSLTGGIQQSLPNNIDNNKSINKQEYIIIIEYLNEKAGTSFRPSSKATQQHINARLKEGYTVDEFKKVIDKKCSDWKGTEWEQYLRPSTLFGSKFENYLNAKKSSANRGANGVALAEQPLDDLDGIL